jgi:hypothetical protein
LYQPIGRRVCAPRGVQLACRFAAIVLAGEGEAVAFNAIVIVA